MPWLMAALYDRFMHEAETKRLGPWRQELLADLSGRVLEVGAGTGSNLDHYPAAVTRLVLTEPDAAMRRRLVRRLAVAGRAGAEVHAGALPLLPFADGAFDAVVCTLVLCSVPDLGAALAELRRLLRPGGALVFIEHVAAGEATPRRWQRRLEPLWRRMSGNCHLTRPTVEAMAAAGFLVENLVHEARPGATAALVPVVRGLARAPVLAS